MKEKIIINPKNVKCKVDNTGRRMKIYIKLNKSETEGWNGIKKGFDGFPGTDNELVKMMFFRGVNAFMDDLKEKVEDMSEEEKAAIIKEADGGEKAEASSDGDDAKSN